MSSSGVAYPPPSYPPVSIFNSQNYPPIPQAGTATSNNFPNGINLTGTNGNARTITGISNLDFISENSTTGSGLLTQISQNDTQMTIGTPNPAGTIEIDIYGSALLFNGNPVGTGSGNVSTASDNTYAIQTNQEFYDATIDNSLTFPNSNTPIIFDDTLHFKNSNSANILQLRNISSIEWFLEPASGLYPINFNLNFGGYSVRAYGTYVNLNASSAVTISNILTNPNNPTIDTTALGNGTGTFYPNGGLPYFAYNNGTNITPYPLVVSSTLSNYATLTTGTNSFQNTNTFSQFPTITATQLPTNDSSTKIATTAWVQSVIPTLTNTPTLSANNQFTGLNNFSQYITNATQSLITNTSIPANQATFFGRVISGNVVPYFGWTDGTNTLNYQLPLLNNVNTFTQGSSFPYIALNNQSTGVSANNALYVSGGVLTFNYASSATPVALTKSPVFTGSPQAPTPLTSDNSNKIATTAFVQASLQDALPPPKVIFNTPNNTIINTNTVSWYLQFLLLHF